ncbi:Pectinesterase inhibitor domain [Arabidopsis thaliana x Arabidopsis arenosa]|uniref:Pectinesterase inhibitor domain n=1 Tax=Arabidopsis thaliana x Arabidopsis arenosa TaxID=1240361 RepID=A0A8T2CHE1_9BRAS|nr:Pectinesterase inhibitor domain [Arabidopsis thaliana x Arabidopsis arenosa]
MVAYVDKNFSSACLVVLLVFVVSSYARFSTMVTKDEIHFICTQQDINSSFCFEVLKATPEIARLDFSGLAKFLLNYQAQNISDTLKQFKLSGGYTRDTESKYSVCIEVYEDALDNRDRALKYLAAKDYDSLNTMVSATMTDMFTCTDDLSTMKPIPKLFITKSNVISDLSSIIFVILEHCLRKKN